MTLQVNLSDCHGRCTYGMGLDYDGGLKILYKEDVKHSNPMSDYVFDFCPFCGRKLNDGEEKVTG